MACSESSLIKLLNSLITQNHGIFTFKFEDHLVPKSFSYQEFFTSFRLYVPYSQKIYKCSIWLFHTGVQLIQSLCPPASALHTLFFLSPAWEPVFLIKAYLSDNSCGTGNHVLNLTKHWTTGPFLFTEYVP